MVRYVSCFKVIGCAGSQERVDDAAGQNKISSDKRRWSFRRKSCSQRVVIHTVVSNTAFGNRNSAVDLASSYLPATKKSSMHLNSEETNLSVNVDGISASENKLDILVNVEASIITPIQTAIRRLLAQRELAKLKLLVKLQAAIRGHLVRQHAVGALHCIREIVKMQALVRAPYGKPSQCDVDARSAPKIGTSQSNVSLDKLVCNSFACQLLESTPNPKHFNIKCNPSSPSPAWFWMERWMSFASPVLDGPELEIDPEKKPKEKYMPFQEEDIKALINYETLGSRSTIDESGMNNLASPASRSTSHLLEDNKELLKPENAAMCFETKASPDMVPVPNQNGQQVAKLLEESKPQNTESEMQTKPSQGRVALYLQNIEEKNNNEGSSKQINPSFISAKSKFMELTSTGSTVSCNPLHQAAEHDSKMDDAKIGNAIMKTKMELSQSDRISKFIGASEFGTELSITSTLDSTDGSYIELPKLGILEEGGKMLDGGNCNVINDESLSCNDTPFFSNQEKNDGVMERSEDAKVEDNVVEKKLKRIKSGAQVELKTEKNHRLSCSSGKDSPRNLVSSPGSQETPSSQLIPRSGYTKNIGSRRSRDSLSSGKKSSLSSARDSSASDNEQLPQKVHTRRSSLGSATSDLFEMERTYSNGSITLPSYMKATVSAKARLFASTSPRLGPDVLEKDTSITKRHSLPVAHLKQISPKLPQPPKRSGTRSQERKQQR